MKIRYFFYTLLTFILTVGCSQEYLVVKRDDNKLKTNGRGVLNYDGDPFTGEVVNYYTKPNDDLEPIQVETEILEFKKVFKDGYLLELYTYWKDGSPKRICSYKNGKYRSDTKYQHGQDVTYYQNGQIKENRSYKDGKDHGQHISYNEDGTVSFKSNWIEGKKDGEYYFNNGRYEEKGKYVNGKKDGEHIREYNSDSERKYEGKEIKVYDNGSIVSSTEFFNNDLGLWRKIFYKNNRKHGKYVEYTLSEIYGEDDESYLFKSGNYIDGKEDGEWILNQGSGRQKDFIQTKTIYKNGRRISESKSSIPYDEIKQ